MPKVSSDILPPLMKVVGTAGDENEILRLRKGKIERGAFRGTRTQRFKGWLVKNFRGQKYREAYLKAQAEDFKTINDLESYNLAIALQEDLSKRAPVPYKIEEKVTVKRVKELLEQSAEERKTFHHLVAAVTAPILNHPEALTDPAHGALSVVDLAVNKQFLRRDVQVSQLRKEVAELLKNQGVNNSESERLDQMLNDKALKVNLFVTARDYAIRLYAPGNEESTQHAEPDQKQALQWQEKRGLENKENRAQLKKQNVTELATEMMIEAETEPLTDGQRLTGTPRLRHIKKLKRTRKDWATHAAKLYETGTVDDERKAVIIEREGKRFDERSDLQKRRHKAQDRLHSPNPVRRWKARRTLQDVEKQLQEPDPHLLAKESPKAAEEMPQQAVHHSNYPGQHSEMVKDKKMKHRPITYSSVAMGKEEAIQRTLEHIITKYPSFGQKQYEYLINELKEHLSSYLTSRSVAVSEPQNLLKVEEEEVPPEPEGKKVMAEQVGAEAKVETNKTNEDKPPPTEVETKEE